MHFDTVASHRIARKKLLLIAPTCNGEDVGEAWVAYQWARALAERHDVTLLTYHKRGAKPAAEQLSGLRVVEWTEPALVGKAERLNSIAKPGYVAFYFRARSWIQKALARGEHFDVAHQPLPVAMRYPSPLTRAGIPFVIGPLGGGLKSPPAFESDDGSSPWYMSLRNLDSSRLKWDPWLRSTFERASCVVGIAPYVREQLAGVKLQRFEVMSETALTELPPSIDRSARSDPVRLLFVGRLVRTKGVRDLIRAMAFLTDPSPTLDIIGEGPEREVCEELMSEFNLGKRVTLHGWLPKSDVAGFYRRADLFVFPSYREPGGNVALEAMSFSLPLIVVERGGPGSATSEACAIRLSATTPTELSHNLAAAIEQLARNSDIRLRMGAAAYRHVSQTGLWSGRIERMESIYSTIAAHRSSSTFEKKAAAV